MATKFLKKIILQELRNVLREGLGQKDALGLEPTIPLDVADNMKKSMGGMSASQLADTGVQAHVKGAETTPIGKLQARLASKGFRVSNIGDGKQPDGRIGPLTLAALKKVTGRTITAQQLRQMTENPSAMNALIKAVLVHDTVAEPFYDKSLMKDKVLFPPEATIPASPNPQRESLIRKEIAKLLNNL